MSPFVRYTLLRILLFLGVLLALGLVGMRGFLLLAVSAVLSMALSFVVLRAPREEAAARLEARVRARTEARQAPRDRDAVAEDAEDEARRTAEG